MTTRTSLPGAADLAATIRAAAGRHGFSACRIGPATLPDSVGAHLRAAAAAGHFAEMDWMADRLDARASPDALWPAARAAILLGLNYGPASDPLAGLAARQTGVISVYARHEDYHDILKPRLKAMARDLLPILGGDVKVFVDTAPVAEKPLAALAGLGWQGKHTNLVSRDWGSWLFLGVILTSVPIPPDAPATDHCGQCTACLDICPTAAFPAPYQLDARRCISYLTIEHKGTIAPELRPLIGNRIYGCDDCLAVCPWNKFAQAATELRLKARADLEAPPLADLAVLDDAGFRAFFRKSPVKRIGRDRFVRNVMIAIGNSADPGLAPLARDRLADASAEVRSMAAWAYGALADDIAPLDERMAAETDAAVQAELRAALGAIAARHRPIVP